jgi:O-antigen/teichoic acid export membrane protein
MKLGFRYFTNIFLRSELLKNASVLISGSVLAQLISILLQPVLRRLFSPDTFGIFSVYLSIVGILSIVASLRYEDAIVLPRKDKESANVLFLSLILSLVFNILVLIMIILAGERILKFLNLKPSLPAKIFFLIPLAVFLLNLFSSFNFWLIRKKKYYAVSVNKFSRRVTEGISQVVFALLKNPKGLIFSDIIGQGANAITSVFQGFKNGFSLKFISISKTKYVLKKYSEFPRYNLLPSLASTCSFMLPPIIINKFFSSESAGYFDLARVMLSVPIAFITASFSSVLLQKTAERYNKHESMIGDLKNTLFIILPVAFAEIVIISFFSEEIFTIIGGKANTYSGIISKILVWSFAFNFIVSTFTSLFFSIRKIKLFGIYQLFYFLAILVLFLFKSLDFLDFIKVYVLIDIICYTILTSTIIYIVFRYENAIKLNHQIRT